MVIFIDSIRRSQAKKFASARYKGFPQYTFSPDWNVIFADDSDLGYQYTQWALQYKAFLSELPKNAVVLGSHSQFYLDHPLELNIAYFESLILEALPKEHAFIYVRELPMVAFDNWTEEDGTSQDIETLERADRLYSIRYQYYHWLIHSV